MALIRWSAMSCIALCVVAFGYSNESYALWDGFDSAIGIYEMPLEKLETLLAQKVSQLPDLEPGRAKLEFKTMPSGDPKVSVFNAPRGLVAKEALLGWMPDPKKMASISGKWTADSIGQSTVYLTIGYSTSTPSRSFVIIARTWRLKGGSIVPRTRIRLPFRMWNSWPQLLQTDASFLESLGDGVGMTIIERATIFDKRLYAALGMQQGANAQGRK